jgi:hypothetical protein
MGNIKGELSSTEIEANLGIKRNRLKGWVPEFIQPSIEQARGHGTRNRFSRDDVYSLLVLKCLVDRGFTRQEAGERVSGMVEKMVRHLGTLAPGSRIQDVKYLAFIENSKGKYRDGIVEEPGINKPFGIAYPDLIFAKDLKDLFNDLESFDIVSNNSEIVLIINFEMIRNEVNNAFE